MISHLWVSKELWNEMLAFTKEIYRHHGKFPTTVSLREFVRNSGLFSQVGQELVDRLYDALHKKIKMKRNGVKYGFPRFKSIDRMKSLHYPQFGFELGEKLKVTPFGELSIVKHRRIKGRIKTLTIKREPTGKWFACFSVEQEKVLPKENNGRKVGIDLGLKSLATLSDGTVISNPRHLLEREERLAFLQRRLSRASKRGRNRLKAKLRVATVHERISNTRKDFLHKTSVQLVNDYSFIALEKLAAREMAEHRFGKSINDAGWNMFANMLTYKAESAGCRVVFVNPKNTTKECSSCWNLTAKELGERMHNCQFCGLSMDRDLNAARVIVKLAEYPALRAGMNAKRQLHDNFPNEPSYPAHCAGSLASAREALRKI